MEISLAFTFVFACFVSACGEEQAPQRQGAQRSGMTEAGQHKWLTPQDEIEPEVWLIAHEAKSSASPQIGNANDVRHSLAKASATFNDTPRMIANRAVQLEDMLKSEGGGESAIFLIDRLNGAIAPGRIESFGAAGQQYYNMRRAGLTGEQALDVLSKRYGTRG
ncbi:hypothetical protein [Hyphomicrobium sp.]|uniref:hypothetical protein n=1 Tax=Hyphomicrobium sp. TaxID=82 RepID=UPI000F9E5B7A|nr:hypothetical protein [Hyphomicrobium sp.]RUO98522.1 MAG: hypothetical protein EKK30_11980 [Hyphomicrobium sp.]